MLRNTRFYKGFHHSRGHFWDPSRASPGAFSCSAGLRGDSRHAVWKIVLGVPEPYWGSAFSYFPDLVRPVGAGIKTYGFLFAAEVTVTMGNDEPANDDLLRPPVTMGCYALLPKVTMGNERRRNDCLLSRYVRAQSRPGLTTPSDNPLSKLTELNETCPAPAQD